MGTETVGRLAVLSDLHLGEEESTLNDSHLPEKIFNEVNRLTCKDTVQY